MTSPGWCAGNALCIASGRTLKRLSRRKMRTRMITTRVASLMLVRTFHRKLGSRLVSPTHNSPCHLVVKSSSNAAGSADVLRPTVWMGGIIRAKNGMVGVSQMDKAIKFHQARRSGDSGKDGGLPLPMLSPSLERFVTLGVWGGQELTSDRLIILHH